jgi:pyruvate kinase
MDFRVIVTLGPATLSKEKLKEIDSFGDCIYRINGAHTEGDYAANIIETVRDILPSAEIMIDLPGNKIRTKNLLEPIRLKNNQTIELFDYQINYQGFFTHLKKADIIYANDSELKLEVKEINNSSIKMISHSDGLLLNNKGLHIPGIHENIPFIFDRDKELIHIATRHRVNYISLSYVRTHNDIKIVKDILSNNDKPEIIAKIETAAAVENLDSILEEVDMVNVDRGDLSADIGLIKLGLMQHKIIETALRSNKKIFLATQFLKNMEKSPVPSIAEVIDLYKTIKQGVYGIQLSEETAIGKYAVECVELVFDMYSNCTYETLNDQNYSAIANRRLECVN